MFKGGNRKDYLDSLADDFGIPREDVYVIASTLGEDEDFDGLVVELENYLDSLEDI